MPSRPSLILSLLVLGSAFAFVGCDQSTVEIEFRRSYHTAADEEPEVLLVLPTGGIIEAWGLAGGAFRGIELANRGSFVEGIKAPDAPYWYRFTSQWLHTDERLVKWESAGWGRSDLLPARSGTQLSLHLSGLEAWEPDAESGHRLVVWGSGAAYPYVVQRDALEEAAEETTVVLEERTVEEDGVAAPLPAFKSEEGDAVYVAQLHDGLLMTADGLTPIAGSSSQNVVRGAAFTEGLNLPIFSETDTSLEFETALALGAEPLRSIDVDLRGPGFDAVIATAGGEVTTDSRTRILVRPDLLGGQALVSAGGFPFLANVTSPTPTSEGGSVARIHWTEQGRPAGPLHVAFVRSYDVHGTMVETGVVQALGTGSTLEPTPLIGAPGPIRVNGEALTAGAHVEGTPLISWDPPSLGTATGYEVHIIRFTENVGSISEVVYTRDPQLRLPPVFLGQAHEPDQRFVIVVVARTDKTEGFPEEAQLPKVPYGFASRATPRFTGGIR